jgi:HSP20 family protein
MENNEKTVTKNESIPDERTIIPLVDIIEEKDGYTLFADMPGISKDNLDLTIDNNELTITGKIPHTEDFGVATCTEFSPSNFRRTFIVNDEIETKNISATMDNGILRLLLPKSEKVRPKKIEIKSA